MVWGWGSSFCPGGREAEYAGMLAAVLRSCDWVPTFVFAAMYEVVNARTHTHARTYTHAHAHARKHARTRARTRKRTYACTRRGAAARVSRGASPHACRRPPRLRA